MNKNPKNQAEKEQFRSGKEESVRETPDYCIEKIDTTNFTWMVPYMYIIQKMIFGRKA